MSGPSPSVLSVRVNSDERATLEAAARAQRTTLSEFLRRMGLQAAEAELLQRSVVTIPADAWEAFETWIGGPAAPNEDLRALAQRRPSWEK